MPFAWNSLDRIKYRSVRVKEEIFWDIEAIKKMIQLYYDDNDYYLHQWQLFVLRVIVIYTPATKTQLIRFLKEERNNPIYYTVDSDWNKLTDASIDNIWEYLHRPARILRTSTIKQRRPGDKKWFRGISGFRDLYIIDRTTNEHTYF